MRMRAIAGVLDVGTNEEAVSQMLQSMKRRARGKNGVYTTNGITLLTKVDTNEESYPLTVEWAGERYVICFDGRIYNRCEIQQKLLTLGYPVEGCCDGEVILYGYICWNEKVLDLVNGEFAMAILCEREEKVFLARDRMGIKPLFYSAVENGLVFASEIKTILAFPTVEARLDVDGICQLILIGPGRIPGSGILKGIHELKPGHYGIYHRGNLQLRCYWKLKDRNFDDSFEDTTEKVRTLIFDSVRNQMMAPTAVGTMLSGGLDSSIISAICGREYDCRGMRLHTFSLDYQDHDKFFQPGRFQPSSDTEYIRIMQEVLDSHHHWTILTPENLVDGLLDAIIARDLPGMADVDTSLLAFVKKIVPDTSVVLSGECADELFCGYPWFRDTDMRNIEGFPWANSLVERSEFM